METKRICIECGHSTNLPVREGVMRCLVSKVVRTFYSTGTTQTTYRLCDEVNDRGECGKFIHRVNLMPAMIRWWRNWWDNYYEKKARRPQ